MSTPPDSSRSFRRCAPRAHDTRRAPLAALLAAVLVVASACGPEAVSEWDPRQIEAQMGQIVAHLAHAIEHGAQLALLDAEHVLVTRPAALVYQHRDVFAQG